MTAGVKAVGHPVVHSQPTGATPAVVITGIATAESIHTKLDMLLANVDEKIKTEESAAKTFFKKYWPIIAGVLVALSRFVKL